MPKHNIEIPCSVGDKIKVTQGYFTHTPTTAEVCSITVYDTGGVPRIAVTAKTTDGKSKCHQWGKSAFEVENEYER